MHKTIIYLLLFSAIIQADFFDSGRNEFGGSISYLNSSAGNSRMRINLFQVSPFYNYHFLKNMFAGPILAIMGINGGGEHDLELNFGGRIGTGIQFSSSYAYLSAGAGIGRLPYDQISYFALPINVGVKQLLVPHLGIDYELNYTLLTRSSYSSISNFSIAIGIFGLM